MTGRACPHEAYRVFRVSGSSRLAISTRNMGASFARPAGNISSSILQCYTQALLQVRPEAPQESAGIAVHVMMSEGTLIRAANYASNVGLKSASWKARKSTNHPEGIAIERVVSVPAQPQEVLIDCVEHSTLSGSCRSTNETRRCCFQKSGSMCQNDRQGRSRKHVQALKCLCFDCSSQTLVISITNIRFIYSTKTPHVPEAETNTV